MLQTNNDIFKEEIEDSFKAEVAEQLRIKNMVVTETFNQKFEAFQTVML